MRSIVVNGKFLTAGIDGGVHRSAAHLTGQLAEKAEAAGVPLRVLTPGPVSRDVDLPGLQPEIVSGRLGGGQRWEMTTLPWVARNDLLVSFCNLGPIAHRNSVVMIHDVQPRMYPADYPAKQRIGYRVTQNALGMTAKRILTVSQYSKTMLTSHGVAPSSKIEVIPNGCDHLNSSTPDDGVLERHGLSDGDYVLALGSLQAYKNLDLLFRAMPRELDGRVRLVVAGEPNAADYRQRGWNPPSHTVFTGRVTDGELLALYEQARAVAVPSLTEGFGLPPLEAMACGTPVVAAHAGALPEVCRDAALLVDPADPSAWAESLAVVCADAPARQTLITAGRERAEQYTWSRAGDSLWRALQPLLPPDDSAIRFASQGSNAPRDGGPLDSNVAVVVASLGRPESVGHLLERLAEQSLLPTQVVLSVESDVDLPDLPHVPFALDAIVEAPRGLTTQRNRALQLLKPDTDIVVFYDDDFVPSKFAVANLAQFFDANPDLAGADGLVIADGATGPGIPIEEALKIVDHADSSHHEPNLSPVKPADALYGCNMAYRYTAIKGLRFDEELPLYGWFEDLDFGARVDGNLAHCEAFHGVHRGEKKGRERGRRLGYSQVANPIYMVRKGTLSRGYCTQAVARRVLMNHLYAPRPEPWADRRGRAVGNWMAFADLVRGRLHPQRILDL